MLEIGYLLGESYRTWVEYFPLGKVYFMDKDFGVKFPEARFTGDQGKVKDLEKLLTVKNIKGNLDFIIDDGSHYPGHQLTSFTYLFMEGLKPGGIYIVEDVEINYWIQGVTYGLNASFGRDHPDSLITKFKQLVDVVNRELNPGYISSFGVAVDSWVESIFFGANCVVIVKMTEQERERFLHRTYRFQARLKKKQL
jgi:hypothetical protein